MTQKSFMTIFVHDVLSEPKDLTKKFYI
ncbi:hypothetical protein Mgra_00007377 [Meloidogyne graminicola]|uniref:Uncharacterized protein n=1 Tax=Meloidogyne graminicola TaxID=189291 RepID=A0A8S9ZIN6_9BILA|nr:hypothetical protein Mgra_00007377 [Meloidogyne graminicola]